MKRYLFLTAVVFFCSTIYGQISSRNHLYQDDCNSLVVRSHYEYLEVDGMYYTANYQGLKMLMQNYRQSDPELYNTLLRDFRRIERKRNTALTVFTASFIAGPILVVGGATFLGNESSNEFFRENNLKEPNYALIGLGTIVTMGGGFLALVIAPGRNEVYQFMNTHNRNNNQKLEWRLGLKTTPGTVGVALSARF